MHCIDYKGQRKTKMFIQNRLVKKVVHLLNTFVELSIFKRQKQNNDFNKPIHFNLWERHVEQEAINGKGQFIYAVTSYNHNICLNVLSFCPLIRFFWNQSVWYYWSIFIVINFNIFHTICTFWIPLYLED